MIPGEHSTVADAEPVSQAVSEPTFLGRVWRSDIAYSLSRSRTTIAILLFLLAATGLALLAPWVSPHDPFDLSKLELMNSLLPPAWLPDGNPDFVLGTDHQGRDLLSGIIYGLRISLFVGVVSVVLSICLGVTLGLISGYFGGYVDAVIMRIAEVQQTFPALLIALLVDGLLHGLFPSVRSSETGYWVVIASIGLAFWVQYARTVRSSTMVEREKDYVNAARLIGIGSFSIMFKHILPNVAGPVLVIATINLGLAILTEATLSFVGFGLPPTQPSLGTLIKIGNDFLFSGEWWITLFPGAALALLVLAINVLGDWLRDAMNPRLK